MLLEAVGEVIWIKEEGLLDAVTAVSGSGPESSMRRPASGWSRKATAS